MPQAPALPPSTTSVVSVPRPVWLWWLLGLLATVSVAIQLEPAGTSTLGLEGPGQTVDEMFNAEMGVRLADRVLAVDLTGAARVSGELPDHPPAGRLWLGLGHELARLVCTVPEDRLLRLSLVRFGSALAFGGLIGMIGYTAECWWGCGLWSAIAVWLIPRVFGHAHLAALETVLNLAYVVAVMSLGQWAADSSATPRWKSVIWSGVFAGLVWLTKIQAILLPIPVLVWALWFWRGRGFSYWFVWGGVSAVVLVCGWPWLWLDPVGHLSQYLGHASNRSTIQVWYLGQAWADRAVPWHYPWVILLATLPVAYQLVLAWGVWRDRTTLWKSPREMLVWLTALFPLLVFSLPGVAVYDGERLFLISYPLLGILTGKYASDLSRTIMQRTGPSAVWGRFCVRSLLGVVLATLLFRIWSLSPCWLSDYNLLWGGLRGADRLGLSVTYWGDSLTPGLLRDAEEILPAGSRLCVLPSLHPFQAAAIELEWDAPRNKGWKLVDPRDLQPGDYLLIFERREYLTDAPSNADEALAVLSRQGVRLARLQQVKSLP